MFQARCHETLFITDWGMPLAVALILLGLIYLCIYLPAILQHHSAVVMETAQNVTEELHAGALGFARE